MIPALVSVKFDLLKKLRALAEEIELEIQGDLETAVEEAQANATAAMPSLRGPRRRKAIPIGSGVIKELEDNKQYTVNEAAHFLSVQPDSVRMQISRDKLPVERKGRNIFIAGHEIRRRRVELGHEQSTTV